MSILTSYGYVFNVYRSSDANTVGNVASVASVDWGCAVQIMAAVSIGSGLKFEATIAQTLYAANLSRHAAPADFLSTIVGYIALFSSVMG